MISWIAGHQNAILLLDEADVFLEQRSSHEIARNGLVSVFLHKLEYCKGIMFLTTNRVFEFDEAILTWIHLMLRFDELDSKARKNIQETFLNRARTSKGLAKITPSELERLVEVKLNGRQVRTSYTILKAFFLNSPLDQECRGYSARFSHKGEELGTFVSPTKGRRLEQEVHS